MFKKFTILLLLLALFAAACGSDDETTTGTDGTSDATTSDATSGATSDATSGGTTDAAGGACDGDLKNSGTLTVATGEPVFGPWMSDDDPANGMGFESALVYALADEMGVANVEWVRTGFDEAVAPGSKDYDFNIQQFSITAERDEVVDFSDGYYEVEQAIIGASDSPAASATTLAELAELRLGAAIGTTSLNYIEDIIQPSSDAAVYDDNVAAKSAFDAGQVDGIVFDLPTAYYVTAVEIEGSSILGVLPRTGDNPEELGMLFEDGSPLVDCVNIALASLKGSGAVDALEDEWLNQGGSVPSLTN